LYQLRRTINAIDTNTNTIAAHTTFRYVYQHG
jgi:hypothetical protein